MKSKRDLRAEKLQRDGGLERLRVGERRQPFAERAIADLVVILQEQHKGGGRQIGAWRAARLAAAMRRRLALIDETFLEAARQALRRTIGVIARNSRRCSPVSSTCKT